MEDIIISETIKYGKSMLLRMDEIQFLEVRKLGVETNQMTDDSEPTRWKKLKLSGFSVLRIANI